MILSSKPAYSEAFLDLGNSLAQGLGGFYCCNEMCAPYIYDLTGNLRLTQVGGPSWTQGQGGFGGPAFSVPVTAGSVGASAILPTWLQDGPPITFAAGLRRLGASVNSGVICGHNYASSNTAPFLAAGALLYSGTTGQTQVWVAGGSGHGGNAGPTLDTNDHVLSATSTTTAYATYLDGVLSTSGSATNNAQYTATSAMEIGYSTSASGQSANTNFYWAAWWQRALTAAEHFAIGAGGVNAIWRLLAGLDMPLYGLAGGAAATLVRRTLYRRAGSRGAA